MFKKYFFSICILCFCNLLTGCFAGRVIKILHQSGDSKLETKQFITEIPFNYAGNYIGIKGRFSANKSEKRFLLDTGAPMVISLECYKANRFPAISIYKDVNTSMLQDSLNNTSSISFFPKIPEMQLGDLVFTGIGAQVINKEAFEKYACFATDGIIGSNVMNDAIWQIDYARQIITITDDLKNIKNIEGAAKVKFKNDGSVKKPLIPVKLNGKKYWFLFDTGSSLGITFSPELLPFFKGISPERKSDFSMYGLRSAYSEHEEIRLKGTYVNLPEFNLGELKASNVNATALEIPHFEKREFSKKQSGNLGNKFFQNYIVTIDWKKNIIYFAPQPNPVKAVITSHFGLSGRFNAEKKYIVQILHAGSEAEKAGIELNDEILAINGTSLENLSPEFYCGIVNNPEKLTPDDMNETTFRIRHKNGEIKNYTFKRQALFPGMSNQFSIR